MKPKLYLRRLRSPNGFGLILFRPDRLNPWRPYFVLFLRPRQHRVLLRLARHLVGLSWWPPRFWNAAALLAEREPQLTPKQHALEREYIEVRQRVEESFWAAAAVYGVHQQAEKDAARTEVTPEERENLAECLSYERQEAQTWEKRLRTCLEGAVSITRSVQ